MGVVTGKMLVDGSQRDDSFQRKTGYVQQQVRIRTHIFLILFTQEVSTGSSFGNFNGSWGPHLQRTSSPKGLNSQGGKTCLCETVSSSDKLTFDSWFERWYRSTRLSNFWTCRSMWMPSLVSPVKVLPYMNQGITWTKLHYFLQVSMLSNESDWPVRCDIRHRFLDHAEFNSISLVGVELAAKPELLLFCKSCLLLYLF